MLTAYRYRLDPSANQTELLNKHFGSVRYVYNWALGIKTKAFQVESRTVSRFELDKQMTALKHELEWLSEINSQCLQAALRNLDSAYTRFFREKKGFPRFKSKKDNRHSFSCPQNVKVDFAAKTIQLPKIGKVRFVCSRTFEGTIKTVTVSKTPTGKVFASVLVDTAPADRPDVLPVKAPLIQSNAVGISFIESPNKPSCRLSASPIVVHHSGSNSTNTASQNTQLSAGIGTARPLFQDKTGILANLQHFLSTGDSGSLMQLGYMVDTNRFSLSGFSHFCSGFSRMFLAKKGIEFSDSGFCQIRHNQKLFSGPLSASGSSSGHSTNVVAELFFSRIEKGNPELLSVVKLTGIVNSFQYGQSENFPAIFTDSPVKWLITSQILGLSMLTDSLENVNGLTYVTPAIDGVAKEIYSGKIKRCLVGMLNHNSKIQKRNDIKDFAQEDVGLKDFATLSTGEVIANPRFLKKSLKKLKRLSRQHSKKKKGSVNRDKSRVRLARQHERVTNQRNDFLHKTSTAITKQFDTICVEDLNISGMMKNHKLARSIADVSWGSFISMLEYKCEWQGKNLVKIGRFEPSSRLCTCGTINRELSLKDRVWTCANCGTTHERDMLAANNIIRFAFAKQNLLGLDRPEITPVETDGS